MTTPRPGSTLRLEIHIVEFLFARSRMNCRQLAELMSMLIAEACGEDVPAASDARVQCTFDKRDEYRRIRGGFGRRSISAATRRAVFDRDGPLCRYCGCAVTFDEFHCDHVEPVSKGGSNSLDNLAVSCPPCNLSKHAKPLAEWRP